MEQDNDDDLHWIADNIERVAKIIRGERPAERVSAVNIVQHEMDKELSKQDELPSSVRNQIQWNILLYLYLAYEAGERSITKQLCSISGAPATTALRHIDLLVESGQIERTSYQHDQRVSAYLISKPAREMIEKWAKNRALNLSDLLAKASVK